MRINANRLDRSFRLHQKEYEEAALKVLQSGWYVLGEEVLEFEREFAKYVDTKYCVGLASGLDALWIAFRLLGVGAGDEVIVSANAYIACVMGITMNGATPVFVEPDAFFNLDADKIEDSISEKTKAILAVHLYGQPCNMEKIVEVAKEHGLYVVEDCAQAHGAMQNGKKVGSFGDIGCFSFYPSKNIGAFGDAGAVTTNSSKLDEEFRVFRNYGSEERYYNRIVGTNSRLDELQAAMLRVRLKHIEEMNDERVYICQRYLKGIKNPKIVLPQVREKCTTVWHQFVIMTNNRESLIEYLNSHEIGSIIHYPIPPHLSEAYRYLGFTKGDFLVTETYAEEVLSLPLYNGMREEEIDYVIEVINAYE